MATQPITRQSLVKCTESLACQEATAERLYLAHVHKADELAKRLCFHYACSGALAFEDEARSVARIALWNCARKFDPKKQRLQYMQRERQLDESFLAIMLGYPEPQYEYKDPYANFWIASIRRVRGSVLDLFRSERLITKPPKGQTSDTMTPTMLYHDRFLSMDRLLSDASSHSSGGGSHDTFGDMIPSPERTDKNDEVRDMRTMIEGMKEAAGLTDQERRVLDLYFSDEGLSKTEVAAAMGISSAAVSALLTKAIEKLRQLQPT